MEIWIACSKVAVVIVVVLLPLEKVLFGRAELGLEDKLPQNGELC